MFCQQLCQQLIDSHQTMNAFHCAMFGNVLVYTYSTTTTTTTTTSTTTTTITNAAAFVGSRPQQVALNQILTHIIHIYLYLMASYSLGSGVKDNSCGMAALIL